MYLSFVNECLIKGKSDFFDPVKKVNLDIELKKTNKIWKAVSVMKEDKQAFGVMLRGRRKPRMGHFGTQCISAIKLSISRFNSKTKSKTSFL